MRPQRNLTTVYNSLVKLISEREPEVNPYEKVDEIMAEEHGGIRYYVTLMGEPKITDIPKSAAVKTPAKYFNNLEHAKLFQLKIIFNHFEVHGDYDYILAYSDDDIRAIKEEYIILSEKYPEYAV